MYIKYQSNNSGGRWWLTDKDWKSLESFGWKIQWVTHSTPYDDKEKVIIDSDGMPKLLPVNELPEDHHDRKWMKGERWLGALAKIAYRSGLSLREAVEEWELVTGQNACDIGCTCCGPPHSFSEYDDNGQYVRSGPPVEVIFKPKWT